MNSIKQYLSVFILLLVLCSCGGDKEKTVSNSLENEKTKTITEVTKSTIDIASIKENLCSNYPEALVMKYNIDATNLVLETVDDGSGGIMHCNVKLFYGEKKYEYWKGQVSATVNQAKDPFWQYNPKRNAILFHEVENLGERAVYISNMFQLQILKSGVLYSITPPNRGRITNTGKENKDLAIEIAKHYKL